jgi:DNA polymerase V
MFGKPVHELTDLKEAVATYTSRAAEKLRRQSCAAKLIEVFVVTNDYEGNQYAYNPRTKHNHVNLLQPTSHTNELIKYAVPLVEKLYNRGSKYLKAGVVLGGLVPDESIQGNIFKTETANHQRILMEAMDNINFSMRDDAVKYVASGFERNWKMRQEMRSGDILRDGESYLLFIDGSMPPANHTRSINFGLLNSVHKPYLVYQQGKDVSSGDLASSCMCMKK